MLSTANFIVVYLYSSAVFQQNYIGNVKFSTNLDENEVFDYVVIGGGTAGSLVAARLSEDPSVTVLLMDRGGSGNDFTDIPFFSNGITESPKGYSGPPLFKVYETTPQKYACADDSGKCVITQGNALGGGSNANSNYERGSPLDFDEWERMGARGWSYIDVLPFFKSTEKCTNDTLIASGYHGTKGDQFLSNTITLPEYGFSLQAAAQEQGFIVNKDYSDARFTNSFGFTQNYIHGGQVYSSRRAFLAPALKRKNLKVICFAQAAQILFNSKIATGVKYHVRGKDHVVKVSKEVIVSSGPIGSPQLLMLSGIGNAKELRALGIPVVVNLPAVGKNLQDQAALTLAFKLQDNPLNPSYGDVERYVKERKGPLSKNPTPYVGFINVAPFSVNANDTKLAFYASIQPAGFGSTLTLNISVPNPASKGYVKLRSADPFDDAIVDPAYFTKEEDRKLIRAGAKILVKYAQSRAFKSLNLTLKPEVQSCAKDVTLEMFMNDDFIDCYVKHSQVSLLQLSSTCRMGDVKDTRSNVVDPQLRIIGIENVRVIDSSIMPHQVRASPAAATTMIGEKGAFMIRNGK